MDEIKYHTRMVGEPGPLLWGEPIVNRIYTQVFRTSFSAPGLALISLPEGASSRELRRLMWDLKGALGALHRAKTGKHLVYLSMGRFDSQVTTKFHLDGAPDEAFLMLGYEPSPVHSELSIADYSRAAYDWGISPRQLLTDCNPMFADHENRLRPYIAKLTAFDPAQSQIVLLNNSSLPFMLDSGNLLGVMHQATIAADTRARRIIDSTMLTTAENGAAEAMSAEAQRQFLDTSEITGSL